MRARYRVLTHPIQTIRGLWYDWAGVAYDRWHGIETGKRGVRIRYDPTEPKYIRWTFRTLRNLRIDTSEYSFVDFGSGKGRVLAAAAQYPFLQVIGIEYAKELHEAALQNIHTAKRIRCWNVTSVSVNALDFSIPDSPCVLFFYHPFKRDVMEPVLVNIHTSLLHHPRPLFLIYVNPLLDELLMRQPGMRLLRERHWCKMYFWSPQGAQAPGI
jgi:SAM-dependent methyltransferase